MHFQVIREESQLRVVIEPAQDISFLLKLEEQLLKLIEENSDLDFALDFINLPLINSSTIGLIAVLIRNLELSGRKLTLCHFSSQAKEALDFTELSHLVNFSDRVES